MDITLKSGKVFLFKDGDDSYPFRYVNNNQKGVRHVILNIDEMQCLLCGEVIKLVIGRDDWFFEEKEYEHLLDKHKNYFLELIASGQIEIKP